MVGKSEAILSAGWTAAVCVKHAQHQPDENWIQMSLAGGRDSDPANLFRHGGSAGNQPGGSMISRLRALWNNVFRRNQLDDDLDEELSAYAELVSAEKVRSGMSLDEARRSTRREIHEIQGPA
jgi:hypothetical protein